MCKCDEVYTILLTVNEKFLGIAKYELSLCNKCNLLHTDVEDGICNICDK
jgi:hypothetical protein